MSSKGPSLCLNAARFEGRLEKEIRLPDKPQQPVFMKGTINQPDVLSQEARPKYLRLPVKAL